MNIRNLALTTLAASTVALASGCATSPYGSTYGGAPPPASANCYDCGTVTRIEMVAGSSSVPNRTGAVVGGIVGAVAGREIAKNQTDSEGRQNTATVAGAVAGAVAGNAIQNRTGAGGSYNVYVRMSDGRETVVTQSDLGGIRQGSYVRVYNGRAWPR
ncbi:peptidoglycan-associated outer membrane lipoprotein precursor [Lysobacter oculi]|uniref:Peptidoglycan-associated outer membrane lipoprotein n=1 Tax=Solilutibacter oculi TaxID=2698682 RepID=A0A344J4Y3_9GAMM|nr:glycine zipper 2TM domain-containing protein [Lysobacter oculi]AXA84093.1 peptidoglycan-associated outer membrane lipoprotein precursor [Lysobacter oculi]